MASFRLVIVSILVISVSDCYPYGAPACVSAPRHGLEPQQGDPDIKVSKEQGLGGAARGGGGGGDIQGVHAADHVARWRRLREYDPISRIPVQCSISGEFQIEDNANITRVECNGLLGSAGEDTKVNNNFACFI